MMAAKTRLDILERAVSEDLLVVGMHLNFPAFSRVARAGAGFIVQPEAWRPYLTIA